MNEELQSTNDELQSINEQLHLTTAQVDAANGFLETVLAGLRAGVVVVDDELRIRSWNRRAEELWGFRSAEVTGQHFLNLDIGLPFDGVRPLLRAASGPDAEFGEVMLQAVNRRGRTVAVRVACSPLGPGRNGDRTAGAVIVMESDDVAIATDEVSPP
jgi:two-component system CheB/CheR fusion protein